MTGVTKNIRGINALLQCPLLHFPYYCSTEKSKIETANSETVYSFFPRTVPEWNSLDKDIAEAPSLSCFKSRLP